MPTSCILGFPGGSVVKNPPANVGDIGSVPGLGRFPGEGNGNPLQYSCLGNPMDRGTWWATAHGGLKESDLTIYRAGMPAKSTWWSPVEAFREGSFGR